MTIAREADTLFREMLSHQSSRRRGANTASLNILLRIWRNLSEHSESAAEREEALRSVLTILKELCKPSLTDEWRIRPTSLTVDLVESILDANNIEDKKQAGVLRLLGGVKDKSDASGE